MRMKFIAICSLVLTALFPLVNPAYGELVFEDDFAGTSIDGWWDYEYVGNNPNEIATQDDVLTFTRAYTNETTVWGRDNASGIGSGTDMLYVGFEISNYVYTSGDTNNNASIFFRVSSDALPWSGNDVALAYNVIQDGTPREGVYQIFINNSISNGVAYSHPTNSISGTLDSQTFALYRDGALVWTNAISAANVAAGDLLNSLGWGTFGNNDLLCSFDIDNFEVHDTLEYTTPVPPPPGFDETILFDDFDNGSYRDVNTYTGGSTANFWSSNSQFSEDTPGSQLVATIDSSAGNYKSANSTSGSYSPDFSFFDKTQKLKVRGISFDGTTGTDPTGLTDIQMQQWYAFLGDGTVAANSQDSLWAEVRGDGRVRLKARNEGAYLDAGAGNAFAEATVANITGFDLTLEPGDTGTDYELTLYGDSTLTVSGNIASLTKDVWGAGDGGTKLGLWAQEVDGVKPGAGEFIMVSTVGSYEIVSVADAPNVTLLEYGFDQTNASPDVVAANIATADFMGGTVSTSTASATPIDGPPVVQTAGPDAVLSFTVTPDVTNQVEYTTLSFEMRMYTQTATIERKVEITSSATGTNVLYTLYNFAGWQLDGSNPADDKLGNDWESRTIDLSGIAALQGVGPVTFSFNYIDITPGGGSASTIFMDAIEVKGRIKAAVATGFAGFAVDYGLSGTATDDYDGDGLLDYGEYVFGGLPNDAGDQGTQPVFDAAGGNYVYSLIGDTNVTAHVVSTANLVLGPWVTNNTVNVSVNNGVLGVYSNSFGTGASQLFIKLELETP